jgi:Ca2+-binding RTX toxin-like protein
VSEDLVVLDHRVFNALTVGQLNADAFFEGKAAHDADDRIIYDAKNGKLFYDADGKGGEDALLFAKLDHQLDLTHTDFLVV